MEKRKAEQAQAVLELGLAVLSMMVQAGPTERVNLIKGWEEAKESPSSPPEGVTSLCTVVGAPDKGWTRGSGEHRRGTGFSPLSVHAVASVASPHTSHVFLSRLLVLKTARHSH